MHDLILITLLIMELLNVFTNISVLMIDNHSPIISDVNLPDFLIKGSCMAAIISASFTANKMIQTHHMSLRS